MLLLPTATLILLLLLQPLQGGPLSMTPQSQTRSTFIEMNEIKDESEAENLTTVGQEVGDEIYEFCSNARSLLRNPNNNETTATGWTSQEICQVLELCGLASFRSREGYCPYAVNNLSSCFSQTKPDTVVYISCPAEVEGISYDTTENASRICHENGTWNVWTNYTACRPIEDTGLACEGFKQFFALNNGNKNFKDFSCKDEKYLDILSVITKVGRSLSVAFLSLAFLLFWSLRSIRCWRNIIHWNLATSFIFRDVLWFIVYFVTTYTLRRENTGTCRAMMAIFHYTRLTNFCWMFVEGLHLHMMVVLAYSYERFNLRTYMVVGWGLPVPIIVAWAIVRLIYDNKYCWMLDGSTAATDLILHIPVLILLMINGVILVNIIRILVIKLRAQISSDGITNYFKAAKAALFLFPLLGISYLIFIFCPTEGAAEIVFLYINTILESFQGFFVCIIFCFSNTEIQNALLKKWRSWRYNRGICLGQGQLSPVPRPSYSTVVYKQNKPFDDCDVSKISSPTREKLPTLVVDA